jgi:hypothetical protein
MRKVFLKRRTKMDISALNMESVNSGQLLDKLNSAIIDKFDKNGDGSLDSEEVKFGEELFSKLDTDGSGKIEQAEIQAHTKNIKDVLFNLSGMLGGGGNLPSPDKIKELMGGALSGSNLKLG